MKDEVDVLNKRIAEFEEISIKWENRYFAAMDNVKQLHAENKAKEELVDRLIAQNRRLLVEVRRCKAMSEPKEMDQYIFDAESDIHKLQTQLDEAQKENARLRGKLSRIYAASDSKANKPF